MDKRKPYFIPVSVIPSINLFFAIIKATIKGAVTVTNDVIIGLNNFEISLSEIVPLNLSYLIITIYKILLCLRIL